MATYTRATPVAATAAELEAARHIQLSEHFTLAEFYVHEKPPADCERDNLNRIVTVAEWFRTRLAQGPCRVTSYFRSASHNGDVGGAPQSGHLTGDAVDLTPVNATSFDLIAQRALADIEAGNAPPFGQMILYSDQGHAHLTNYLIPHGDDAVLFVSPDKEADRPRSYIVFDTISGFRRVFGNPSSTSVAVVILAVFFCSQSFT